MKIPLNTKTGLIGKHSSSCKEIQSSKKYFKKKKSKNSKMSVKKHKRTLKSGQNWGEVKFGYNSVLQPNLIFCFSSVLLLTNLDGNGNTTAKLE